MEQILVQCIIGAGEKFLRFMRFLSSFAGTRMTKRLTARRDTDRGSPQPGCVSPRNFRMLDILKLPFFQIVDEQILVQCIIGAGEKFLRFMRFLSGFTGIGMTKRVMI